ncbi:MAG: PEGA domain-containing protein [Blastocatellia bacterium]
MKCHHCSREVKLWQTFCPACGNRLQGKSFSTIAEAPIVMEPQSRRQLLRKTLQFTLLALAVIVLASVIRLGPPRAHPVTKEVAKAVAPTSQPAATPEPVASPPSAEAAPVAAPAPPPEVQLPPINFLTDVLELRSAAKTTSAKLVPVVAKTKKKQPEILVSIDDVLPRRVSKPVPVPKALMSEVPPPAPLPREADANLDVDTAYTLLQPNVGLVSIKSYVPARVYIDGVYSGVTPRSVKLLAGQHSISLMAGGYQEYTRTVQVSGRQQIGILASLSKK